MRETRLYEAAPVALIDDMIDQYRDSLGERLFTIHAPDGKYIAFNRASFEKYGIDTASMIGGSWQEYCACSKVDQEMSAVAAAIAREDHRVSFLGRVVRFWPGKIFEMEGTMVSIRSRAGATLILRGNVNQAEMGRAQAASLRNEHHAGLQTIETVSAMLDGLSSLDQAKWSDKLKGSIERSRKEVEVIRNRYIRQLI